MAAAQAGGYPAAIATVAAGMLLLLALQGAVARCVAAFTAEGEGRMVWSNRDDGFTGGILSMTGQPVIPARWVNDRAGAQRLAVAIDALDGLDEQATTRSAELESDFRPIPCVTRRIEWLEAGAPVVDRGAWHVARYALYTSWACLGMPGRAVHCNCGRPALWAFLPAD